MRTLPLALTFTVIAGTALAAPGITVNGPGRSTVLVPKAFAKVLNRVRTKTSVPILLPNLLVTDIALRTPGIGGTGRATGYDLELGGDPSCNGANACFVAAFLAEPGATLGTLRPNVTLAKGTRGRYERFTCGASCGPNVISWLSQGTAYSIQVKGIAGRKASMMALANQAITAGPR